ncbi:MAG: hypothetical protein ACR2O3_09055 [Rhizobiaceae bacterium]
MLPSPTHLRIRIVREVKKALVDVTPPILLKPFRKKAKRPTGDTAEQLYANSVEIGDQGPSEVVYLRGNPVFKLPVERLRYSGGISYFHDVHPMRIYYKQGVDALRQYYAKHQPSDILEKHFLTSTRRDGISEGGVPWVIDPPEKLVVVAEKGLEAEQHGVQHFGPVSEKKLLLEQSRLDLVRSSLESAGYQAKFGFSTGYFLENDKKDWVFVITGGQHRVAAMIDLGFTHAPAQFHSAQPRIIRQSEISQWPMVRNGSLTEAEAQGIFESFFDADRKLRFATPVA